MGSNGGNPIHILYKVVNSESDTCDTTFNAFVLNSPRPTLAAVKQHCAALYGLNHLGPEGYHWRVFVEDKGAPGDAGPKSFSWWDIQDENAALPVKEATQHQLGKFFGPPKVDSSDSATKAAKGAFKALGKAVNQAAGLDMVDGGPPVKVVAFKLLDLVQMHDDFAKKHNGVSAGQAIPQPSQPKPSRPAAPRPQQRAAAPANHRPQQHRPQARSQPQPTHAQPPRRARQPAKQQEASLMDFGPPSNGKNLHHSSSMPSVASRPPPNETRPQKLQREAAEKAKNANRVWDPVDERWVEKDPKVANSAAAHMSSVSQKKEKGMSMEASIMNAANKSANVQQAVNKRANEMKEAQDKALREIREREQKKQHDDAEEDMVRKRLEPKLKAWSEEHGKKKQLRALLANLHTILWPGANWKQVTIGDLLDDRKVTKAFHKASRVVHPDKAHHLDAEKRFMAKRIFDSLCQAKTEFDAGKN